MATTSSTYYYEVDIYTDASSQPSPGPSGIAVRIVDPKSGRILFEEAGYIGQTTSNRAEYTAIIFALDKARGITCRKANLISDNMLAVKQIEKIFKVQSPALNPLFLKARNLIDNYYKEGVSVKHLSEAGVIPSFDYRHHQYCDQRAKNAANNRSPILKVNI